ncbi:GDSL-type esterase/lipase family protein [Parablautia intestinalis]|uniref:GDSL-type esterase/lipase family protein n=1 Tax=Parablautia intestinalis TaxID=2320100 RepID=UPI00256EAFFC|nr:GDSL-type esterase/lipase family protein [Parablautia intestinalis]
MQEQKTGLAVQGGIDMDIGDVMRDMMRREQQEKLERYRMLNRNVKKGQILFTGSSLMEQFPINELLMTNGMNVIIYNRGIGGFTTVDMLEHMEEMVFGTEPSKIFINIGTNDIGSPDYRQEDLLKRYEKIISLIKGRLPEAQIFMMAYYPVNETDKVSDEEWGKTAFATRTNKNIAVANEAVERLAAKTGCHFINVNQGLTDERGKLKKEFTVEGIHMYANGYQVVLDNLKKYL